MGTRLWTVATATWLLAGCPEATQLTVIVDTDYAAGVDVKLVRIRVQPSDNDDGATTEDLRIVAMEPGDTEATESMPFSFGVVPRSGDARRRALIAIEGFATENPTANVHPLVSRLARSGFVEGHNLRLPMFLWRSCEGIVCTTAPGEPLETCIEGECLPAVVDEERLGPAVPGEELCTDCHRDGLPESELQCTPSGVRVMALAAGDFQTCAITADGDISCWGQNDRGQLGTGDTAGRLRPAPVDAETTWISVAPGAIHTCAIDADGSLWCWGSDDEGTLGRGSVDEPTSVPARVGTDADWRAVASSSDHSCAIKTDGTLWCWGRGNFGQVGAFGDQHSPNPVPGEWQHVTAGAEHTCGIRPDGTLWCFGSHSWGQLGLGQQDSRRFADPQQVGLDTWRDVSAGFRHSCGVTADGRLYCWGRNDLGQLGTGDRTDTVTPVRVGERTGWTAVAVGRHHGCALREEGSLWCWGASLLGTGEPPNTTPVRVGGDLDWVAVSSGAAHVCGLKSGGSPSCFGSNAAGQLGTIRPAPALRPRRIGTLGGWRAVTVHSYACARRDAEGLWCWGENTDGQLGTGNREAASRPVQVGTGARWTEVDVGSGSACGLVSEDQLYCWGRSVQGQLGIGVSGDETGRLEPVLVGTGWDSFSVGHDHACGIREDGTLLCWGANYGQALGVGDIGNRVSDPAQVGVESDWISVSAGTGGNCALRAGGSLWCWGWNRDGQAGAGHRMRLTAPERVGEGFVEVSTGTHHACGRMAAGDLACWGSNDHGQLGLGDATARLVPTRLPGTERWSAVSVGHRHTCAIGGTGRLWCWGVNEYGQLGTGDAVERSVPTRVGHDEDWIAVHAGTFASCGVKADGTLWCWGTSLGGSLGFGPLPFPEEPVTPCL